MHLKFYVSKLTYFIINYHIKCKVDVRDQRRGEKRKSEKRVRRRRREKGSK